MIQEHLAASPNFRGVRTPFPKDLNNTFLEGFRVLADHNLSYDNWHPDYQRLQLLAKLANLNLDVTIIVNHLGGKIDTAAGSTEFDRWRSCITAAAACPNTRMKLGGTQMQIGDWKPDFHMHQCDQPLPSDTLCELMYPYYSAAIDEFGVERCMFESNFPVDRECVTYRSLWNMFKQIAAKVGASDGDKEALFSGTAARAYRLAFD